jgi:6-phosphogluconolactonase
MSSTSASLLVVPSKNHIPQVLHSVLIDTCTAAIKERGVFTIALSGGSLPSFLSDLNESFKSSGLDPRYDCWHVLLADERCVPSGDPENNLSAIRTNFLAEVPIPEAQIYGIDESKLNESTETIAIEYEKSVREVLPLSGGYLDLAILGFGPDGMYMTMKLFGVSSSNSIYPTHSDLSS